MLIAAAGFNLFPDPLFSALMVLPFAVTAAGLHLLLFKPYMAYLEAREQVTQGAQADAVRLDQQAEEALQAVEAALAAAREEAAAIRAQAREAALREEAEILSAARAKAGDRLDVALEAIRVECEAARADLRVSAQQLAADVADGVLGHAEAA